MAVYKITNKQGKQRWRAEVNVGYRLDGSKDVRTRTCKTKKDAERAEFELKVEKVGLRGRSDRMTLKEFWDGYYRPMKAETLRRTTMQRYESTWNRHLLPALGTCRLSDIDRLKIQRLLSSKETWKVAKNTRDLLRQILGEAREMGAVTDNQASGRFRFPEKPESDQGRYGEWVSDISEHKRMISLAEGDVRVMLVLGLCFGLRKGEIVGLNWEDIDFSANCVHIRRTCTYTKGHIDITPPKTEKSVRDIPMAAYARDELKRLRGRTARIGPVLVYGQDRMPPYMAKKRFEAWVAQNDVPAVTLFSLRHSYATAAIKSGMDVAHVSRLLGHTTITTTYNRYVKPLQSDLEQAVEELNRAYSNL